MPRGTNGDGRVDLQDLNNVRNNFDEIGLGDANQDGVVNLDDLNLVRNNFGTQASQVSAAHDAVFALLARSETKLNVPRKAASGRTGAAV